MQNLVLHNVNLTSKHDLILVINYGSPLTGLIVKKIRELNGYSILSKDDVCLAKYLEINKVNPIKGVILSGGPASVYNDNYPTCNEQLLNYLVQNKIPILGICYGMQLLAKIYGGTVTKALIEEHGHTPIKLTNNSTLHDNISGAANIWMSHGDEVTTLPQGFILTSNSDNCGITSYENVELNIYGVQYHPESQNTKDGGIIIDNFINSICKINKSWTTEYMTKSVIHNVKQLLGNSCILYQINSSVTSIILAKILKITVGDNVIFIDGGCDKEIIQELLKNWNIEFNLNNNLQELKKQYSTIGYIAGDNFLHDTISKNDMIITTDKILNEIIIANILHPFEHLFLDEILSIGKYIDTTILR